MNHASGAQQPHRSVLGWPFAIGAKRDRGRDDLRRLLTSNHTPAPSSQRAHADPPSLRANRSRSRAKLAKFSRSNVENKFLTGREGQYYRDVVAPYEGP